MQQNDIRHQSCCKAPIHTGWWKWITSTIAVNADEIEHSNEDESVCQAALPGSVGVKLHHVSFNTFKPCEHSLYCC